jgi:hypothetical protein
LYVFGGDVTGGCRTEVAEEQQREEERGAHVEDD